MYSRQEVFPTPGIRIVCHPFPPLTPSRMTYQLPESHRKAVYVRERFDQIARHYDLFNDLITQGQHRYWKRFLVRRLKIGPGQQGADLCCGTGDIYARALRAMGPSGHLIGLDFSNEMLQVARNRLQEGKTGLDAATPGQPARILLQGDAMSLPLADNSLQFVSMGYGLRNVTRLEDCLQEIYRVLAPGGVFGSLDVGKVTNPLVAPLARFYMFRIVPLIGKMLQPGEEMYSYLPHSADAFPSQQALADQMAAVGFEQIEVINFLFGASAILLARKPATP